MYPEIMVIPMREELTRAGIKEARTAEEVDAALAKPGTTMLVVNSICGCAAGKMRPGVRMALQNKNLPDQRLLYSPARIAKPPSVPVRTSRVILRRRPRSLFSATASWCT